MTAISEDTVQPHDGSSIRILQTNPNPEVHFTTVPIICRQRHLCKAEVCLPGVASPGWDESVPVSLYVPVLCRQSTCIRLKFVCQVLPALDGMNLSPYLYMYYADKGTCIRLKFVCQVLPALEGMNLSPYLSFCGEFTGVRCFLVILGCTNNKVYNIFVNKRYQ